MTRREIPGVPQEAGGDPPAAPTGLAGAPAATTIAFGWDISPDPSVDVYVLYELEGGTWTPVWFGAPTTHTLTGLAPTTSYSFRLTAVNIYGESVPSATVVVATTGTPTVPAQVTGLTGDAFPTSVVLGWTADTDPSTTSYNVYQLISAVWTVIHSGAALTYTVTGLAPTTSFSFRVTAVNTVGESTPSSTLTISTTATPTVPSAPTGLVNTGYTTPTKIWLAWNANPEPSVTNYKLYQNIASVWTLIQTLGVAAKSTSIVATASTAYSFRLTAINGVGESVPSTICNLTTPAAKVPLAPTGLGCVDPTTTTATLVWNVEAAVTSYKLYQLISTTWTLIHTVTGSPPATTYTVTGLTAATTYSFRLTSTNASGESNPSVPFTLTTDAIGINLPVSGAGAFDITGVTDESDHFSNWINNTVPNGADVNHLTRVLLPRFQLDGITPAKLRLEGGSNLGSVVNVVIDGGGTPGRKGMDGLQFIQTIKAPYKALADPTANPRGVYMHEANTFAANSHITNKTNPFTAHVGDHIEIRPTADPASYTTRTVMATNVGGDPKTITYSGASVGTYSNNVVATVLGPDLTWNVVDPDGSFVATYASDNANGNCYTQAKAKTDRVNGGRSFFLIQQCTHLAFRHIRMTGTYDNSGYDSNVENQDGIQWQGCIDCELGDSTVEQCWGNGQEGQPYVDNSGTYIANRGIWCHDSDFRNAGRQCQSITFGYNYINERCYLGGSGRSLIDSEPTTQRPWDNAGALWTVQDVHWIDCTIGTHGLGMYACHEGVGRVHISGCTGESLGTSGTTLADYYIFENNTMTSGGSSPSRCDFVKGNNKGGTNIIVQNNSGMVCSSSLVQFHAASNGGCTNYLVTGNVMPLFPATSPDGHCSTGSPQITSASKPFSLQMIGSQITGPGIPTADTYIFSIDSTGTKANLSSVPDVNVPVNAAANLTTASWQITQQNPYADDQTPPWAASGTFVPFTLPVPAHALRDLGVQA